MSALAARQGQKPRAEGLINRGTILAENVSESITGREPVTSASANKLSSSEN